MGSPIKVEIANGSLDKIPYLPPDEDQDILEIDNMEKTPMLTGLRPRLTPKNYNDFILDDDDDGGKNKNNNNNDDDDGDDVEPIFQKRKKISTSIQKPPVQPPVRKRSTIKTKKKPFQEAGTEEESHSVAKNSINSKNQSTNPRKRAAKSPTPEYPERYSSKKSIIPSQTSNSLNSMKTKLNNSQSNKPNTFSMNEQKEKINKISKNLNADEIESMITDDEDNEVVPNSQEPEKCTDRLNRSSKFLQQSKFSENKEREEAEKWQKFFWRK
ncbi:uncharacterized protein LOC141529607 [Cotesia typhae]|uniref:uncharacterized protein LOC141529607 n=1 Tax=Cotesia typhae TaxID=2053667 RepID=UPI003D6930B4